MTSLFLRLTVYLFIGLISSQTDCAAFNLFRPSQDFPAPVSVYDFLNVKNRENQVGNLKLSNSSTVQLQDPFVSFFGDKPLLSKVIREEEPPHSLSLPSASRDNQIALSISQIIDEMAKMFKSTITKENILSRFITENDEDKEDEEEEEDEENENPSTQNLGQSSKPTLNSQPSSAIDLLVTDIEEDIQCDCDEEKEEEDGPNSWLLSYPSASNSGLLTIISGLSVPKESSAPLSTSDEDKECDCDEDADEGKKKEEGSQSSPVANSESLPLSGNINEVSASTIIASPSSGINIEDVLDLNEDTDDDEDEDEKIADILESLALSDIISEGSSALESASSLSPGSIGIITDEHVDEDEEKEDETIKNSGLLAPSNSLGAITGVQSSEDILSPTTPTSTQSSIFSPAPATDNSGFLSIPQTISDTEFSVINKAPVAIESFYNEDNVKDTIQSVAAPVAQSSPMTIAEPTIMSLVPPFYFVTSTTPAPKSNFFTGNECRDPSVPDGKHIPYPGDCNKFIHCDNYKAWVKNCGVGLHFNRFVQVCDWPASAGCI